MLRWTARIGAVTAEAIALRHDATVGSAGARLAAAERRGQLLRSRPLAGRPALYTITREGLRACDARGLEPCRVTHANAAHLIACASTAAALERVYPNHRVLGERELRRDERDRGAALASAQLGPGGGGARSRHRPDLVLWPAGEAGGRPVAVEVELTVKAPRRLVEICRAWARCRSVAGVLYLFAPECEHALARAIAGAGAQERIVALPLETLPLETLPLPDRRGPTARTIPGRE
jgi:hypothetical protein